MRSAHNAVDDGSSIDAEHSTCSIYANMRFIAFIITFSAKNNTILNINYQISNKDGLSLSVCVSLRSNVNTSTVFFILESIRFDGSDHTQGQKYFQELLNFRCRREKN